VSGMFWASENIPPHLLVPYCVFLTSQHFDWSVSSGMCRNT
jgi:hypothetical protein